jgi:DNA-directed RNA polymerase I and III subunit RPAC1
MKSSSITRFENLRYEDKGYLKFQIVNTHVSYVNTLRRVGISEVKSVGFRAEILKDGSTSDVKIENNTTPMSNEMLAHRIGLIPVHANPSTWNPEKYVFKCDIKNNSLDFLDVKVSDIDVFEKKDNELIKVPNVQFFHPDPITRDTALIAVLKPKVGSHALEQVSFTAKATVGIGRENARFNPTSQFAYSYTRDDNPDKVNEIFVEWLDRHKKANSSDLESDPDRKAEFEREFNTMEVNRCYKKNEKGEPYSFDFTIESVGVYSPYDIVKEAIKVCEEKCFTYSGLDKGSLPENIKIQPTKKEAKGYDIYFQHEDHTLGNLLTTWLDENLLDPLSVKPDAIRFCGYCVPHPLRDEMLITMLCDNEDTCRKALATAASNLSKMFAQWRSEWEKMK